jgi:hypothetical protein
VIKSLRLRWYGYTEREITKEFQKNKNDCHNRRNEEEMRIGEKMD